MKPKASLRTFLLSSIALATAGNAGAQAIYQWNGTTDTTFGTVSNWSPTGSGLTVGPAPSTGTSNSRLNVNNTNPTRFLTWNASAIYGGSTARALVIASGSAGNMVITGGTFDSRQTGGDLIANGAVAGSLTIDGGTYTNTSLVNTNTFFAGFNGGASAGSSTLDVLSGNFSSGILQFGQSAGITVGVTSVVNLDGGILTAGEIREGGSTTPSGSTNASLVASTLNFNGGTLRVLATNANFLLTNGVDNAVVKSGGAIIDTNNFNATISKALTAGSPSGGLTKQGAGTLTLSGTNTYTGGTTVTLGTLTMGSAGALGSTSGALTVNGGTLNMAANNVTVGNLTGSGGIISGTSGTRLLTIGQGDFGGGNYLGQINDGAGGTTALTKTGAGTITLSGANGYTGATNINGGTLLVNNTTGSGTGSDNVTVGTSGTLGGSGTIAGAVTVNGNLKPGNSTGLLSVGSLDLNASSSTTLEINGTDRGAISNGYDALGLNIGGTIDLAGSLIFQFGNISAFAANTDFDLFSFTTTSTGDFTNVTSTGFYAGTWDKLGDIWSLTDEGQTLNFSEVTGSLTVIPEPNAVALIGGFGLLALLRRRR